MRWFAVWAALVLVGAVAACSTRAPVRESEIGDRLGFLQPQVVSRSDIEARLGPPANVYEDGRIATWHIHEREGHFETIAQGSNAWGIYCVVLAFDAQGRLERRGLVRIR